MVQGGRSKAVGRAAGAGNNRSGETFPGQIYKYEILKDYLHNKPCYSDR
jgi:hypothetical protein